MSEEITVAEALTELKRIVKLIPHRLHEIELYASKRKGSKDTIEGQKTYFEGRVQSARDLVKRYYTIKVAIAQSNLKTMITWKDHTMTVHEAILYKTNSRRDTSTATWLRSILNVMNDNTADGQILEFADNIARLNLMTEEQKEKMDLIPERYYDPKKVEEERDAILELESRLDALIDGSNHKTIITI